MEIGLLLITRVIQFEAYSLLEVELKNMTKDLALSCKQSYENLICITKITGARDPYGMVSPRWLTKVLNTQRDLPLNYIFSNLTASLDNRKYCSLSMKTLVYCIKSLTVLNPKLTANTPIITCLNRSSIIDVKGVVVL